ncbi:MAG TPA: lysophospholipase [Anaerolineales bacterium]|nr:lysophospholipase [Anaerolineae bacterium]HRJ57497.1 lysophospholipase [Anaerolineales bacterium]HRK88751.1 lysophospholipase [Anaerolineales bacterium]
MKHQEMRWKSRDGLDMFAQVWEPDVTQPRAVVCLVHGLGEHSSRYAHVAEAFTKEGFILFTSDLRGHGRSGGLRGHISSIEDFMQDIDILMENARSRYAGLPLLLYGHSLGGILVLHYGLIRKPDVRGVIATSSGLRTALEKQPLKVFLAKMLGALIPKTLITSGLDSNGLSHDEKVVQVYNNDPLNHDKASLGFGKTMLGVTKWTLDHAGEFSRPLLLMHGKEDAIAFPSGSIEFAAPLKERCTLVLWEGGYHELHNEPDKAEVLKTMTLWIDARLREG